MGLNHGGKIVTDGLVLMLDAANIKSFPGEPTTNIVPYPTNNARFTTSNGWATYNTNMYCDPVGSYGCGVFWYMGTTISSVSSNIVTTTSAHPFRSFDVLRPQTTGGGLTANTDYVVKKISSTEFSLHEYNGSQNGSQGYINPTTGFYKVHDAYATDTRIAVNSTSFPTMWWGAPHLPNSGLIKEIVVGGGYVSGTNCMRLHAYRPDGVVDGMAYGVYPHVTIGDNITISVYLKAVTSYAAGKTLGYSTHFGGYDAPGTTFTLGNVGVWNRYSFSWTASTTYDFISYWWPQGGTTGFSLDMADFQVEIKSYPTPFTLGTRGVTVATGGGWKDLSGNGNHGDLTDMTYNSSGMTFNGTTSKIVTNRSFTSGNSVGRTWEVFVKPNSVSSMPGIFGHASSQGCSYFCNGGIVIYNEKYCFVWFDNSSYQFLDSGLSATIGQYAHVVGTWNPSDLKPRIYVNGVLKATYGSASNLNYNSGTVNYEIIGNITDASNVHLNGNIGNVKFYNNKCFTDAEVLQNYNALKSRYIPNWELVWTLDSTGSIYSISRVTPDIGFGGCSSITYAQLKSDWSEVKLTSLLHPEVYWTFSKGDNPTNLPLFLQTMLTGGDPGTYMTINVQYSITLDLTKSSTPNGGSNPYQFMHNNDGSEPGDIPTFGIYGGYVWSTGMYWGNIDAFSNYGGLLNTTTAHVGSSGGNTGDRLLIYVR